MIYDIANLKVEIKNEKGRTKNRQFLILQKSGRKNIDITINVDEKGCKTL